MIVELSAHVTQPDYPSTYLGILGAGFVPNPVNPPASVRELVHALELTRPSALLVHPACLANVRLSLKETKAIGTFPHIVLIEDNANSSATTLAGIVALGQKAPLPFETLKSPSSDALAFLPFSRYFTLQVKQPRCLLQI
jgi:acyl-CoA synthetase (AMP-forming)/AMP-acid ligase II